MNIASNYAMRAETFWAAWEPICDFRRRLRMRLRLNRRLAEQERERRAALESALRAWALFSLPVAVQALPLVLWWPVGDFHDTFLAVGVTLQGEVGGAFAWSVAAPGDGYEPLALTEVPWADMVPAEAVEEQRS